MMRLSNYFKIAFDDTRLSDARISKFADLNLARIQTNDPEGKLTALIAPTQTVINTFKRSQSEKMLLKAQREGVTVDVDDLIAEFRAKALQREGLIRDTFGKDSREYQEFYPLGTREYTLMNKTSAELLMGRMEGAYLAHAAELPEARVQEFSRIFADYKAARAEQLVKASGFTGKVSEKSTGRAALELQLQKNLLTIALAFVGQPDKHKVYFEQSLLSPYRHSSLEGGGEGGEEDDGSYTLTIQANSTRPAEFSVAAGETLNLFNGGDVALSVYTAATADAPLPEGALVINPGEETDSVVDDLGPAGSTFLLICNQSTQEGSISIAVL